MTSARRVRRAVVLAVALPAVGLCAAAGDTGGWSSLTTGRVVLLRHANAPGVGDPPGFELGHCSTQRNLEDTGRAQARRIGESFRAHRVEVGAVVSSRWCRTHETAELAFPGRVRDDPRFDSFFEDDRRAPAQTRAALEVLAAWRGPGVLVVVTHQVNITALTGIVPASGEGVVIAPEPAGPRVVGRIRP